MPADILERLRERLKLRHIGESRFDEDVHLVPLADIHDAIWEIEALRETLEIADAAINPKDKGGLSMHKWNKRLKEATTTIRAALAKEQSNG